MHMCPIRIGIHNCTILVKVTISAASLLLGTFLLLNSTIWLMQEIQMAEVATRMIVCTTAYMMKPCVIPARIESGPISVSMT